MAPGNVNFGYAGYIGNPPYNLYNYNCWGPQQVVVRGFMASDSSGNIVVLPVHFDGVTATLNNECKPTVTFANLTESGIDHYVIERSIAGAPFIAIDSVLPTANNGGAALYNYNDTASINSYNLYRIKAIETSGSFFYSMILRVNGCHPSGGTGGRNPEPRLILYPNPSSDGRVVLSGTDIPRGKYDIVVVSASGRLIKVTFIDHPGGNLNKLFDFNWLPEGAYYISLRSPDLNLSQKLLVAH